MNTRHYRHSIPFQHLPACRLGEPEAPLRTLSVGFLPRTVHSCVWSGWRQQQSSLPRQHSSGFGLSRSSW